MALGILEPNDEHVAGTVYVYEQARSNVERLGSESNLKRDRTGKITLIPQPSDDPNDPLNWPVWKRDTILAVLTIVAVIATTAAPLLAADSVQLAIFFVKTFQDAANLTAFHLAGCAVGAVIFVPSARVWGKRHVFLFGALLMTATSAWGGSTHGNKNYTSLLWARVFQGVALAPFESLTNAVVGDLYFVHERGPRMAIVNTAIFGGAFLTPVFVGMIAKHVGWQWSFYFLAIFMGIGFLALFFFVPETAYRRATALNTDMTAERATSTASSVSRTESLADEKHLRSTATPAATSQTRDPYIKQLLPINGRKTDDNYFKLLLRPFPLYLQPAVLWGCLMQGVIIGWTVIVGVILSLIFLSPPLFFTEEQAGKMYTAAFIGAMIGLVLSGIYTELVTRYMIRLNNGKYEPEYRILLALPTLIFTAIGLYGFGITASDTYKYGWLIPDVFIAFIIASMVMGAICSAQYLLDAHRDIDIEIFTNLIIFKNVFSFVLAYFAYTWVFSTGIKHMFVVFGSIEVVICLLSVPMYVFGKRNRAFWGRHDILRMCNLR
ncbi:hypothetical protein PMZ80_004321 [Knufia obscura]|uniref:Major facilitator superfamily (MFS) profile domain-containing protein n=2 Tax=Knufia TaxID=430999 RepID=A0AAN8EAD4_9EURO|nr:hypothetical protein PMZ80_004321 [Knufia obscura]KAK5949180.1 hypothetical protein OHC33_009721 [Knufia fluminis]